MKCVILVVIAISASGAMFVRDVKREWTSFKESTVDQDDNMLREVEDREEKTFNFFIVPGTVYCGLGNISDELKRFSIFPKTDKCCELQDRCESISSGETKHGIFNGGMFPMQPCPCDHEFKDCLLAANTWLADEIGDVYFNNRWISKHCFDVTPPFEACGGYTIVKDIHRCTDPIFKKGIPATYRVFEVPFYIRSTPAPRNTIEDNTEIMHNQLVEN